MPIDFVFVTMSSLRYTIVGTKMIVSFNFSVVNASAEIDKPARIPQIKAIEPKTKLKLNAPSKKWRPDKKKQQRLIAAKTTKDKILIILLILKPTR